MADAVHTAERLKELQVLPLERKILISQTRIIEWYQHYKGDVCVSFSGGKDSTVLLHLVRQLYPDVKAVFADTGLEYPEIKEFVKKQANVEIVRPKMRFDEVIRKYGYPLISKALAQGIFEGRKGQTQKASTQARPICRPTSKCVAWGIFPLYSSSRHRPLLPSVHGRSCTVMENSMQNMPDWQLYSQATKV